MTKIANALCGICQVSLSDSTSMRECSLCRSQYHEECWEANGGCAVHGCANAPQDVDVSAARNAQNTHWGESVKKCPMCGEKIAMFNLSCPFCHANFGTAEPMTREQYRERFPDPRAREDLQKGATTFLIASLVPVISPLTLLIGGIWYLSHRKELKKYEPLHALMASIGVFVSFMFTIFLLLALNSKS